MGDSENSTDEHVRGSRISKPGISRRWTSERAESASTASKVGVKKVVRSSVRPFLFLPCERSGHENSMRVESTFAHTRSQLTYDDDVCIAHVRLSRQVKSVAWNEVLECSERGERVQGRARAARTRKLAVPPCEKDST